MSKHSLLLVDGDTRSLRVLEVSLRKAGFTVTSARSVQDALDKLELGTPDLIISETAFPDGDGFDLRRRVRGSADWAEIPFVFLTAEVAIENKIRGLELGVDDYLTKPIYIKEIVARINILLQKRQRARFEERRDGRMRFAGRVADMPVVDVIQTIEISRKSGVIQFTGEHHRQGAIYFREGKVIDAEAGALQGEDAVYRLLTWSDGDFEVVFRTVRRRDAISTSSQGLLMEGMRRLDEWSRLLEQLPPLEHRFEIDTGELSIRLGEVPDDHNEILRLIDGKRTLIEVIDACQFGDLECLQAISRLYFEGLLIDLDHGLAPRRDTGKPVPLVAVDEDAVIEEIEPVVEARLAAPLETSSSTAGYRPSALRLIEEAVLAAEAVEPTLYDGPDAAGVVEMALRVARAAAERAVETEAAHAIPHIIEADEPSDAIGDQPNGFDDPPSEQPATTETGPSESTGTNHGSSSHVNGTNGAQPAPTADDPASRLGRDDSGLRMIGSLGRDRAEASGEVALLGATEPSRTRTQREMVTILPRRITREIPITPPPATPPLVATPTEPEPEFGPEPAMAPESTREAELPPRFSEPPRRNVAGGTRRSTGPSLGAICFLLLAVALAAMALYKRVHQDHTRAPPTEPVPVGAMSGASHEPVAVTVMVDADARRSRETDSPAAGPVDAATAGPGPVGAGPADAAPVSSDEQALQLMAAAKAALDRNRPLDALDLADRSLKLHRTTNTFLVQAQALQRLDRNDDAATALVESTQLTPGSAHAWEVSGHLLWTMKRYEDARNAMLQYLDLAPNGESAAVFRRRLSEPK